MRARTKSSIEIRFPYRGERCEEVLQLEPTAKNMAYAKRFRGEIMNAIERGTFDYARTFPNSRKAGRFAFIAGDTETVCEALTGFLTGAQKRVERSTYLDWRNSVNHVLIPVFGHMRLSELRQSHVQAWIDSHDLTQKRISNILTPLRHVMREARTSEKIDRNPLSDFKVMARKVDKLRRARDQVDPFTPDEIRAIVDELHPQAAFYAMTAVWSGLRPEEMLELRWPYVDLKKGVIRVRFARTRGETKAPKTRAGLRDVQILEPARTALEAQRAYTALARSHVFHDPRTDAPYATDKQFREWQWRPAVERAGVRYRPPHQLRHTYATWLIGAGENIKWVSQQMGHESTQMTLDTYADWIPAMNPDAGSRAEALWGLPDQASETSKGGTGGADDC